jgi:hypothetical protein
MQLFLFYLYWTLDYTQYQGNWSNINNLELSQTKPWIEISFDNQGKKMLDLDLQLSSLSPFVASPLVSSTIVPAAKHSGPACVVDLWLPAQQQPVAWIELAWTTSTAGALSVASSPTEVPCLLQLRLNLTITNKEFCYIHLLLTWQFASKNNFILKVHFHQKRN